MKKKWTVDYIKSFAHEKGFKLLSIDCKSREDILSFLCLNCNEIVKFTFRNLEHKNKKYCARCNGMRHTTESVIKKLLSLGLFAEKEWGGYKGTFNKFVVKCLKNHSFETCWHDVKNYKLGCPYCHNIKNTEDSALDVIKLKGGNVDSDWKYKKAHDKFFVTCKNGHRWKTNLTVIKRGYWCPECGNISCHEKRRLDGNKIKSEIIKRGGIVDESWIYIHARHLFPVTCNVCNRTWSTSWNRINNNHWCPYCNDSLKEKTVRKVIENIFCNKFPTRRPPWLINPKTNGRLELDGYNEGLKIAFEYQGEQHYLSSGFNQNSEELLSYQKYKDYIKKEICKKEKVLLIEIPYWLPESDWESEIKKQMEMEK